MREKAGTHAVFAAALSGTLPIMYDEYITIFWFTVAAIVVLFSLAIVLLFHDKLSCKLWKWIVKRAEEVRVGFTAAGFGLVTTSLFLFQEHWMWLAWILFIVGAVLIGFNVAQGLVMMRDSRREREKR